VKIERENQTLATVTFQNYFRKYKKLAGMTGTAETEAPEFAKIYNLDVVAIRRTGRCCGSRNPTWSTDREGEVRRHRQRHSREAGVGPADAGRDRVDREIRAAVDLLRKRGIKHVVLNAKYHAQEAEIVAQAGRKDNVTIATNMAGRGTDILLGGSAEHMARQQCLAEEVAERLTKGDERFVDDDEFVYFFHLDGFFRVKRADWERIFAHFKEQCDAEHEAVIALGGLHILGTERHEARRIDNQLRGRAGRQGDPGSSRFYLSLEDDLMRIFGSDRISGLMQKLGMEEGVPIEHGMVTRAIERAQKQVEAQNFSVRKHLLEYDDVMNKQRESTYTLRREILEGKVHVDDEVTDSRGYVMALAEDVLDGLLDRFVGKDADVDEWDIPALLREAGRTFGLNQADLEAVDLEGKRSDEIGDEIWTMAKQAYAQKEELVGPEVMRRLERDLALQIVDTQWKDHLYSLDHLKEGIGLRGYGQRDPLVEYKKESFALFQDMRGRVEEEIVRWLFGCGPWSRTEVVKPVWRRPAPRHAADARINRRPSSIPAFAAARPRPSSEAGRAGWPQPARGGGDDAIKTVRREEPKVGRNDPCPCGSGKKYKKCHGMAA
jgi:preprotein translocase subunit SecA